MLLKKKLITIALSLVFVVSFASTSFASTSSLGDDLITAGSKYIGTPYQYGANPNQTNTFDCSSFTQRVFLENGIILPRTTNQQYELGTLIPLSQAKAGDLVFYHDSNNPSLPGHVGIYMGNMQMLNATTSKGVKVTNIWTSYWTSRFLGVKHVLPRTYEVVSGDSLWKISQKNNVTIDQIMTWNHLTSAMIYPGQSLVMEGQPRPYIVHAGDTLWNLSQKFGISISSLKTTNHLTSDMLLVGQILTIPAY